MKTLRVLRNILNSGAAQVWCELFRSEDYDSCNMNEPCPHCALNISVLKDCIKELEEIKNEKSRNDT